MFSCGIDNTDLSVLQTEGRKMGFFLTGCKKDQLSWKALKEHVVKYYDTWEQFQSGYPNHSGGYVYLYQDLVNYCETFRKGKAGYGALQVYKQMFNCFI